MWVSNSGCQAWWLSHFILSHSWLIYMLFCYCIVHFSMSFQKDCLLLVNKFLLISVVNFWSYNVAIFVQLRSMQQKNKSVSSIKACLCLLHHLHGFRFFVFSYFVIINIEVLGQILQHFSSSLSLVHKLSGCKVKRGN